MVGVLAAECCITNEPKLSGVKQPPFVMFPFYGSGSCSEYRRPGVSSGKTPMAGVTGAWNGKHLAASSLRHLVPGLGWLEGWALPGR